LVLARELEPLAGVAGPQGEDLRQALQAGVLAPDAGYYPGADLVLAEAAHHARPWAFAHRLLDLAADQRERAFALGWLSHVVADDIGHRDVVDVLAGSTHEIDPLSHKRVEWGLDCWLLARPEHAWLWQAEVASPAGMDLWARALAAEYGASLSPGLLKGALAAEMAQVRRLPRIFWRFGLLRRPDYALGNVVAAVNRSTLRLTLLGLLAATHGSMDARAVLSARPAREADAQALLRAMERTRAALEDLLGHGSWPLGEPPADDAALARLRALAGSTPGQPGTDPRNM
jgi:hypothetical protein